MSMAYIRDYYSVPAKRGGRIAFMGKPGTIVGSRSQYLRVRLDHHPDKIDTVHPTWEMEYQ
jgi:hypothetical protein